MKKIRTAALKRKMAYKGDYEFTYEVKSTNQGDAFNEIASVVQKYMNMGDVESQGDQHYSASGIKMNIPLSSIPAGDSDIVDFVNIDIKDYMPDLLRPYTLQLEISEWGDSADLDFDIKTRVYIEGTNAVIEAEGIPR